MRRRARKDDNQDEIVAALLGVGASVAFTHQLGGGLGDLIVGYRAINLLAEIKDGNKPPSQQRLTPAEKQFHGEWKGRIDIINSIDAAYRMIGVIK